MEDLAEANSSPRYRWIALALIAGTTVLRLVYLGWHCPLDLAPDEAHYWDWSRHLDWSYYSKGPLVAWLIRLSCACFGPLAVAVTGDEALAVRLPAVGCGSLLLLGLHVLTAQVYRSEKLACAVTAMALTLPIVLAGGLLMTIDAPFTCCWMWALVFAHRAVFRASRWAWPAAGMCVLLGVLAKHTMILWFPSFALFLGTTPAVRMLGRRPGVWIMAGLGTLGAAPILVWNAANDWVTFKHTQSHAGLGGELGFYWLGPATYLGAQFGVLLGYWFLAWVCAMWQHRPTRDARPEMRFLWWMSAPTFVFFGLFSCKNGGGEANWPVAGYLSGMVLGAGWLARLWADPRVPYRAWSRRCAVAVAALGVMLMALFHRPIQLQPILLSIAGPATKQQPAPLRRLDPTTRLRGWRHLAAEFDRVRAELAARGVEPVLAAERWTHAAELGFYCDGQPNIFCLGLPQGDRRSQYDLWRPNPIADAETFAGRTFLLAGNDTNPLCRFFASAEKTRVIEYRENGQLIEAWTITIAHGFRGFGDPSSNQQY